MTETQPESPEPEVPGRPGWHEVVRPFQEFKAGRVVSIPWSRVQSDAESLFDDEGDGSGQP